MAFFNSDYTRNFPCDTYFENILSKFSELCRFKRPQLEHYKFLFCRANNSAEGKSAHTSEKPESKKDDIAPPIDRVILGQASNPNKDEIPDRGTRRIKGGGRVRKSNEV